MSSRAGQLSRRQANRLVAKSALHTLRGQHTLPLTWLGTAGRPGQPDGWQDGMWSHPLFAAGGTALAGILEHQALTHGLVSPLPLVGDLALSPAALMATAVSGAGVLGAAAGLVATAGERFSGWARTLFMAGPLAAGGWLTGVAFTSPFNIPALASAAVGAATFTMWYRRARDEQDRHEALFVARRAHPYAAVDKQANLRTPPPAPVYEEYDSNARKWNATFKAVGLDGCKFVRQVDTLAGIAVLVKFPTTGKIGVSHVEGKLDAIERNQGMLKDCLEVDTAVDPVTGREFADRCWIHVDVADILSQIIDMPDDHTETTIDQAFRIGTFMDGKPMTLRLREIATLIIGVRGRGKTNLFHVIVHQLSRCIDVVLWAIDLKGGRAVKPWLRPWLADKAPRPIFDWVATTRMEAALMMHAAHALIEHRGEQGGGGSKLEPSETTPAVLVLCDEIAALVGQHSGPTTSRDWADPTANQVSKVLTLNIQLGRSELVDFVLFSQRSTVTMVGGGDLKSQCEQRLGLGVTNPSDATSIFQNNAVAARKLRRLKGKRTRGACLVETGDDPNHLAGKTYFYGDGTAMVRRIEQAAQLHAMYPADLPLIEQQAIDDALRELTATRDKQGNIVAPGEICYGAGPDGAAEQRWSLGRAAHLYQDGLADEWVDDDPGGDDSLGGTPAARPAPAGGAATATRTRPTAATRPDASPSTAAAPADGGGSRYYTRRRDRQADADGQSSDGAPAARADDDVAAEQFAAELDAWLATLPETTEPDYAAAPEEVTRYDLMIEIVREAGPRGIFPHQVEAEMRRRGRSWASRTDMYPALARARDHGVICQPGGKRGRYYHADHVPGPPRTGQAAA